MQKIKMIYAVSQDGIIGSQDPKNSLPRPKLPIDMNYFKKQTIGNFAETNNKNVIIMGRKTFDTIPEKFRPLPDRHNLVLTNNENLSYAGIIIYNNKNQILDLIYNDKIHREYRIIGGKQIYELFADDTKEIYRNIIHENFASIKDPVFEPEIDFVSFQKIKSEYKESNEKNPLAVTFEVWQKKL